MTPRRHRRPHSVQNKTPLRFSILSSSDFQITADDYQVLSNDITWWRGGTLSKLMFQRRILPSSMIREVVRQGGSKKIPELHYVGGHETPRCSRQLIWRSAVGTSRNIAQLALLIRYLDFHVRWSDLFRPEHSPLMEKALMQKLLYTEMLLFVIKDCGT